MTLTFQSTWPRITLTTCPKLTSPAQAPMDAEALGSSFLLSSCLCPPRTQQLP